MYIPDNQKIAICWGDKPIGLVVGVPYKPSMFGKEITMLAWHGEMLGEEIAEQSPNEVYRRAREIAKAHGLRQINLQNGADVTTLYSPAFEE